MMAEGLSYCRVLVDCDDSLKQRLDLEKVLPALIERKVVPKGLGKVIKKKKDTELLLGWLKKSSFETFIAFLDVLESKSEGREHKDLMKIMSGSLSLMKLNPLGSDAAKIVTKFMETAHEEPHKTKVSIEPPTSPLTQMMEHSELVSNTSQCLDGISPRVESPATEMQTSAATQPNIKSFTASPLVNEAEKPLSLMHLSQPSALSVPTTQPPVRPPEGYIECKSQFFTRGDDMSHYLPAHGISVTIPLDAMPSTINRFLLSTYVYLQGPFEMADDIELCTPVVWFSVNPSFTFNANVTIKIPHSAIMKRDSSSKQFCLLRAQDLKGPIYELSEEILDADFSDGYHVVARVRHFSPYAGGYKTPTRRRGRSKQRKIPGNLSALHKKDSCCVSKKTAQLKQLRSSSRGSSLESSAEECPVIPCTTQFADSTSSQPMIETTKQACSSSSEVNHATNSSQGPSQPNEGNMAVSKQQPHTSTAPACVNTNEFCISRVMPRDRSGQSWEAAFYICYRHPTGVRAIQLAAKAKFGEDHDLSTPRRFRFAGDFVEFHPAEWNGDGWGVSATETNQLDREDVMFMEAMCAEDVKCGLYPPHIVYAVQALHYPPMTPLNCPIEIRGVNLHGRPLLFVLTSTSLCNGQVGGRSITTSAYLYSNQSIILQALTKKCDLTALNFNLQSEDGQKFLAEISLQLNHPHQLAQLLLLTEYQAERILADYPGSEAEQVYQALRTWAARNPSSATLSHLLEALRPLSIQSFQLSGHEREDNAILDHKLNETSVGDAHEIMLTMGEKLQTRWKFVARLMGVPEHELDAITHDNRHSLGEQSYEMLVKWQRRDGEGATYGVLFKAVHAVYHHDPANVNDAWMYARHVTSLM